MSRNGRAARLGEDRTEAIARSPLRCSVRCERPADAYTRAGHLESGLRSESYHGGRTLILAVDDEAGILRLIRLELTEQGFNVTTASNAEEALSRIESEIPDLVLLDVLMPGMLGIELLRKIRERWQLPIIMVTARDRDVDKVRALEAGRTTTSSSRSGQMSSAHAFARFLRRSSGVVSDQIVRASGLEVDLARRVVARAGEPIY